ncbi:MAG: hypothetical protein K2Q15_01530, partial [Burkholderiales bacterium]|nr:hypothetical protein [Burkholderiales bacterium]
FHVELLKDCEKILLKNELVLWGDYHWSWSMCLQVVGSFSYIGLTNGNCPTYNYKTEGRKQVSVIIISLHAI